MNFINRAMESKMFYDDLVNSLNLDNESLRNDVFKLLGSFYNSNQKLVETMNIELFCYGYCIYLSTSHGKTVISALDEVYDKIKNSYRLFSEDTVKRNLLRYYLLILDYKC